MNVTIPTDKLKELAGYGLILGAVGLVCYFFKAAHNMNAVASKIGKSVDEIANSAHVDISEAVVNDAVRKVAEAQAYRIAERSTQLAVNAVRDDIRENVKAAVNKAYSGVEDEVRRELKRQAQKLDIDALKEEIVEQAKEEASEKLDKALDGILEEFNGNLKNVSRIYKSIANVITGGD